MTSAFLKDKKILITGAEGYIGTRLRKKLGDTEAEIYSLDYKKEIENKKNSFNIDITKTDTLFDFLKQNKFDIIYHLASLIEVQASIDNPFSYYSVNSIGTLNLLEGIRRFQDNPYLIYTSTGLVYGKPTIFPIDEKHPINPNNPYSNTKAISEMLVQSYSLTYNIRANILRLFTIYGPHQKSSLFIPSFIRRCITEKKIPIGNLNTTRDFIFIDDVIDALDAVLNDSKNFNIYNIASGKETKISDVVDLILSYTNRQKKDVYQDKTLQRNRKSEINRISVNINKAKKELKWEPKISLKNGIKLTIKSIKAEIS